jgi:hypothetical protein
MKSNINRRQKMSVGILPPKNSKEYFETVQFLEAQFGNDKEHNAFVQKSWEKVHRSLEAQLLSNCDLITELSLRNYLSEFNGRAWKHGLRSMPVMFNIMEAFFNYKTPEIYFELIEEENYLISFFDFIDFITSNNFNENKELLDESISPDIIYNFNIGKDLEKIKFKTENGSEFIIAGVSIIRRENEITLLMTTGKKKESEISLDINSLDFATDNPDKIKLLEKAKADAKNEVLDYEYIDDENIYIKVLVACRIDFESMTIDARYVAEETTLMFNLITDEIDGFVDTDGKFFSADLEETYNLGREQIEAYNAIFEAIKFSLYLPYYFNENEKFITEENLETHFKAISKNPLTKRKYKDVFGYKASVKSLYSLDLHDSLSPDKITLRDDLFKVQSSGYWKKLNLDEIGQDKKGNSIHGRTWVNKNLTWFEAKEEDLIVEKEEEGFREKNAGFIYILRNPTMDENIFKIGLTKNEVAERVKQLSKTSVPDKFYKSQEWNVKDCIRAEKEIHQILNEYRVDPRREFFKIKYDKAISVIKDVVDRINKE